MVARRMTHPVGTSTRSGTLLESIIERAVDPDSMHALMQQFAVEMTLGVPDLASRAMGARVRIHEIEGSRYILCPVPFFYDEARNIEIGFAIDVDQDHFDVYPYMCNAANDETLLLSRLPHCVVRAIKVDAGSYQEIDDKLKEIANESSAILFIANLYAELGVGIDSPVEFFDNRLFQQLIGKILSVKEGKWVNHRIVGLRFNQLLRQLDRLDDGLATNATNEASKRRVMAHLAHFVFETTRLMQMEDLLAVVDEARLYSIIEPVIAHQLSNRDTAIALVTIKNTCGLVPRAKLAPIFAMLVAGGYFDHALAMEQVSGRSFGKDAAVARDAYALALETGADERIEAMAAFLGIPFSVSSVDARRAVNMLVRTGHVTRAMRVERLSGLDCKPDELLARDAFPVLLSRGAIGEAIDLERWTGIQHSITTAEMAAFAMPLLAKGDVVAVEMLARWAGSGWRPRPDAVQDILGGLVRRGDVDAAKAVCTYAGIPYAARMKDVQDGYRALLPDAKAILSSLATAKHLGAWTGLLPSGDFVHELFTTILHAAIDDDRKIDALKAIMAWTGIRPSRATIISEFKTVLRPGPFKGANVGFARQLSEITGIEIPRDLVTEVFSALLAAPLKSYAIDDAAQLNALTGDQPGLDLIQAAYRCILERQVVDMKEDPVAMAKRLQSWTRIAPLESLARAGQDLAVLRGDITLARGIEDWVGVHPQASLVQEALAVLLQHPDPDGRWYEKLDALISWTGVRPENAIIQSAFAAILLGRWLTTKSIDAARSLARLTRVNPEPGTINKTRERLARETQLGYEKRETAIALDRWMMESHKDT